MTFAKKKNKFASVEEEFLLGMKIEKKIKKKIFYSTLKKLSTEKGTTPLSL
jgi:hypothetical protein